jgi:hypothetical protein
MKGNIFIICVAVLSLIFVFQVTESSAVVYTFSDKDFLGGASWGSMTATVLDSDTLMIRYDSSNAIPSGSQVTGFGFTFIPDTATPNNVGNPVDSTFAVDRDDLIWIKLNNLNCIPNTSNGEEFIPNITKGDYLFGVTEGNPKNINPPGILPGEVDIFYLNFEGIPDLRTLSDLNDFIEITGIRLQSLPDDINGGSLFLAGQEIVPVPEPSALLLLGSGLLGLALYNGRRLKK